MSNEDYDKKWLNDQLSDKERRSFEKTERYHFLAKLDRALKQFTAPEFDLEEQESKLDTRLFRKSTKVINWSVRITGIAASVLLIAAASLTYFYLGDTSPTTVSSADKASLYLPDSSFVQLNSQSKLTYDKWGEQRQVFLKGEAYFHVKKGSTFEVVTSLGVVSVIGTKFNVEVWDNYFEVICFEGSVKIVTENDVIQLTRDQSWRSIDDIIQSEHKTLGNLPDWQTGESRFKSVPLKYVIKELERQYDVDVKTKNVDQEQRFTGAFPHDNVILALKSISAPLDLSYKLEEKEIQITGNH